MGFNSWLLAFHNWSHGISSLQVPKTRDPIRVGVLGAADFTPISLFDPARTHADVVVTAIGARNLERAQQQARDYGVARAFGSYQEVIELDDLDAIYVPLPISKHAEWTIKAARAGKHVLVEKLLCCNEAEAREIEKCARDTGKVILEAFHYQFHPANHIVKAIIESGKYGKLQSISTHLWVATNFPSTDIRMNYNLGGGASMDLAYVFSAIQYFVGNDGEYQVTRASPTPGRGDELVDLAMEAELLFTPRDGSKQIVCKATADLRQPRIFGLIPMLKLPNATLEFEHAKVTITNSHSIIIEDKTTGVTTKQQHYAFGPKWGTRSEVYWTTYRYQLEAFVAKIRGEKPPHWLELKDSVALMSLIDQVYDKAGLPRRGLDVK